METDGCPTVGLLASKACTTFSHWGLNAGQIDLFLAAKGGPDNPSDDAIASALTRPRLGVGKSLAASGILSGAWLVARNCAFFLSPWRNRYSTSVSYATLTHSILSAYM